MTKAEVKLVRSLQQKKFRDELGYFVAEGDKCINELKKQFELVLLANPDNATPTEIAQMSSMRAPQGSIAVFRKRADNEPWQAEGLVLALDGVQDPGNLGTIIRTADWFGVRDIVCSKDTADCYNPKVVQATMGALTRVRIHYVELVEWMKTHLDPPSKGGRPIIGTMLEGEEMWGPTSVLPKREDAIIVMGNEGNGISPEVRALVTNPVRIPSWPKDAETSESLNVAVATAIILAEMRRPH